MIYSHIFDEAAPLLENAIIQDYILGLDYTAVKTDAGSGMAYTFRNELPMHKSARTMEEDLRGRNALETAERYYSSPNSFEAGIGLAIINSALNNKSSVREDFLRPETFRGKRVGMVGWFRPMLEMMGEARADLKIFELKDIEGTYKPEAAAEIMPQCDVVMITGVTFINKTFHTYVPHIRKDAFRIILGPTTPMSVHLIEAGWHLAGSRILDFAAAADCIAHGLGTRNVKGAVEKIWI
jgi:hypothetical protein